MHLGLIPSSSPERGHCFPPLAPAGLLLATLLVSALLALPAAAAGADVETRLGLLEETTSQLDAKLSRQLNELLWREQLGDVAMVEKVRFTGPPPRSTNAAGQTESNHIIVPAMTFIPRKQPKTRKLPLVLLAHGEVHGNLVNDEEWHIVRELMEEGYAVIAPDYRGSSGYGPDYWRQIDYGGLEIADMEAARSFMLARYPQIDSQHVGIIGWSHGGLIALMTVFAHPAHYRACYAGAPVSDLEERIRVRGKGYEDLFSAPYHVGKSVTEAPDVYRSRSPAHHAHELQTPLLLQANTNDEDVTFAEVTRLLDALTSAGRNFQCTIYTNAPGGHQWNRLDTQPARDSRREIWNFLAAHLKNDHLSRKTD